MPDPETEEDVAAQQEPQKRGRGRPLGTFKKTELEKLADEKKLADCLMKMADFDEGMRPFVERAAYLALRNESGAMATAAFKFCTSISENWLEDNGDSGENKFNKSGEEHVGGESTGLIATLEKLAASGFGGGAAGAQESPSHLEDAELEALPDSALHDSDEAIRAGETEIEAQSDESLAGTDGAEGGGTADARDSS